MKEERWDRKKDLDAMIDPAVPRHVVLGDTEQRKRVIIVGDIHGCCDEFRDLLEAVAYRGAELDTVILAGDLVNKVGRTLIYMSCRVSYVVSCLVYVCVCGGGGQEGQEGCDIFDKVKKKAPGRDGPPPPPAQVCIPPRPATVSTG